MVYKIELQERTLNYIQRLEDLQTVRDAESDVTTDGHTRIYKDSDAVNAVHRLAEAFGVDIYENGANLEDCYLKFEGLETLQDFVEYIENEIRADVLEYTHCTNDKPDHQGYHRIAFECGGPLIYAERTPHDSYFTLHGYWGTDHVEITDYTDSIASFYLCGEEF